MEKRYLTIDETAVYTGFAVKTLYKWSRRGMMPCSKVGRILRFDVIEIDKWIKSLSRTACNVELLQTNQTI